MALTFETVAACLRLRVPAAEIFSYDASLLLPEHRQTQLCAVLREIAATNAYYVKLFLSRYIKLLESAGEVGEDIYELYCDPSILGSHELPPTAADTLQYVVDSKGTQVSIQETPKIISGAGTTGLRTWEAALFLLGYLSSDACSVDCKDKVVAELGAGTGLVSLLLLKNVPVKSVVVTDGDLGLVSTFRETLLLNNLPAHNVRTQTLVWGTDAAPYADVVVAADVTYDALVVPQLCDTIGDFLGNGTAAVLVAATVRNAGTLAAWEVELLKRFLWRVLHRNEHPHLCSVPWFRQGTPEIRIYEIGPRVNG